MEEKMMIKRNKMAALVVLAIALAIAGIPAARAQDPTIPTRTPTPDPNKPVPQPTTAPVDPGQPPPPATGVPQNPAPAPEISPTASTPGGDPGLPAATVPPGAPGAGPGAVDTPGSGGGATAPGTQPGTGIVGTCDETPYVKAIKTVTVYAGPGYDYDEVAELGAEDMRPIIGRANDAPWWQILYDRETVGWVADAEVDEYGNTALVPLVAAPDIFGYTPTPGAIWNPTPLPLLTCVPTPTPTATVAGAAGAPAAGGGVAQGEPQSTPTVGMVSGEVDGGVPVNTTGSALTGPGVSSRNADASRAESPTSAMNLILPLAGLVLISGGIVLALVSRKGGGNKSDSADKAG